MDTKWKRFSRSRGFKALLTAVIMLCAGIIGAMAGYISESGYRQSGMWRDVFEHEDYFDSDRYEGVLLSVMNQAVDRAEQLSMGNEPDRKADYYYHIHSDGGNIPVYDSYYGENTTYREVAAFDAENDVEPYIVMTAALGEDEGLSCMTVPDGVKVPEGVLNTWFDAFGCTIQAGPGAEQVESDRANWYIAQNNMRIMLAASAGLAVLMLAALALLCRVLCEAPDGTVSRPALLFRVPYEVIYGLTAFYAYLMSVAFPDFSYHDYDVKIGFDINFRTVVNVLGCAAGIAVFIALVVWLILSVCARIKNREFADGFLCWKLFKMLRRGAKFSGRGVRGFFRFIKELITGELYSADRAARKLIRMDVTFLVLSAALLIPAASIFESQRYNYYTDSLVGFVIALLFIWFVVLGVFIYGRYLINRDEALVEQQIRDICAGKYDSAPQLSKKSPYLRSSEMLANLSQSYEKSISEAVRAEHTKIELITNVSHDLKTPLTSIISYIDLLSREELPPQCREYVEVLRSKSERLKTIVADVFELARTASGDITVEHELLDLTRLSNQTLAEMQDKIEASGLGLKTEICDPPVEVVSDGRRLYRVLQNLLDNALKYSLAGTRIHFSLEKSGDRAVLTIRNIAGYEMDFTAEEILERFARGDKSRSSEGSGLGLSIAQAFTQACGGEFRLEIDGDMFKVTLTFPLCK